MKLLSPSVRRFSLATLACLITTLASVPSVLAGIQTSVASDPPTQEETLISVAPGVTKNQRWLYTSDTTANRHRDVGQTFLIPGTSPVSITSFVFRIADVGAIVSQLSNAPFTLSIYEFADATSYVPMGEPLYQVSGTLPAEFPSLEYLSFTLDDAFVAQAGHYYGVQLGLDTRAADLGINFRSGLPADYAGGTGFSYSNYEVGSRSYKGGEFNFDFRVVGTAIPEGKTAALLFSTLLLGFACRGLGLCRGRKSLN